MVRYGLIGHRIGLKEKYIHFCANEWVPKFINCLKCLTTALAVARTFRSPCTRIFLSFNQANLSVFWDGTRIFWSINQALHAKRSVSLETWHFPPLVFSTTSETEQASCGSKSYVYLTFTFCFPVPRQHEGRHLQMFFLWRHLRSPWKTICLSSARDLR